MPTKPADASEIPLASVSFVGIRREGRRRVGDRRGPASGRREGGPRLWVQHPRANEVGP